MPRLKFTVLILMQLFCLHFELPAQSKEKVVKQESATISGQVTFNGEPMRGVTVILRPDRMAAPQKPSELQSKSDEHGKYRINGVAAGSYYVNVHDPEFILTGGSISGLQGLLLNVMAGENIENTDLALKRGGIITGRVTDSNGNPVAREWIELTKLGEDGTPQPSPFNYSGQKMTDAGGAYRIVGLPDGRYLVSVGLPQVEDTRRLQSRISPYLKTFHPGVTVQSQAQAVIISGGVEVKDVNIPAVPLKKTYEIKGRVVYADSGLPATGIEIVYSSVVLDGRVLNGWRPIRERTNSEGEFRIPEISPGKYAVNVRPLPERDLFSSPVNCEVTDNGITGLEIRLGRGASISGVVTFDGPRDPELLAKLSQLSITAFSKEGQPFLPHEKAARIAPDRSFHIRGLPPSKVNLSLVMAPELRGARITRVERDGVPRSEAMEIGPGEHLSNLRVVISYGSLTLRGEVRVIGGELPKHLGLYMNATRLHESGPSTSGANVDARGQFRFENLIPGDYELRIVILNWQPGEPPDKQLSKLISSIRQKVTVGDAPQPTVTFVVDINQKN
jgi:hypothetical protein